MLREAVDILVWTLHDNLEGVLGTGLPLKQSQSRRKLFVCGLDFRDKPGLLVARHKKINLALLLVAQVEQVELAKPKIRPPLHGLEQMAGDKSLGSLAGILDSRPIPKIPLRRLANRILDVLVVGLDGKAIIERLQKGNPLLG